MPKLTDTDKRATEKIILPSSTKKEEAFVVLYKEALAGDIEELGNAGALRGRSAMVGITNLIKDWNFTEENGVKSEINLDNVRRMKSEDITLLFEYVEKAYDKVATLSKTEKKS